MAKAPEKKPAKSWFEILSARAGAILVIFTLLGTAINFLLPFPKISAEIVDGSWHKLGNAKKFAGIEKMISGAGGDAKQQYYEYEFIMRISNTGNTSIKFTEDEIKSIKICSNTSKRPFNIGPSVVVLSNTAMESDSTLGQSKSNNVMQFGRIHLPYPFFSTADAKVRLISPISDMGGVTVSPIDPIFEVKSKDRASGDGCEIGVG